MGKRSGLCQAVAIGGLILISLSLQSLFAQERITYKEIRAIQERKCFICHGPTSPTLKEFYKNKKKYVAQMKGPRMDTYESLVEFIKGSDAGALMRRLDDGKNTPDGKPGNMYIYLGDTEEERQANLQAFKAWIGHWTFKRKKELTPEDLSKFLLPRE